MTDLYLIVDDGANVARINPTTGATLDTYDIASILGDGAGLGYNPNDNELIATNEDEDIYRLKLKTDLSGIDSWTSVAASGLGADELVGAGFNLVNGNLILNDSNDTGLYADGPEVSVGDDVVPGVPTVVLFGLGLAGLGVKYQRREE
jgi:hypothetical protein